MASGHPDGQSDRKRGTDPRCALAQNRPSVGLHNLLGNGKSQARPGGPSGPLIVRLIKLLEYARKLFGRNSRSGVVNAPEDGVVLRRLENELSRPATPRELEGVRKEIPQHLVDPVPVPEDLVGQTRLSLDTKFDLALDGQHPEGTLEIGNEAIERDGPRLQPTAAGLEPADVEQLLD